MSLEKRYEEAAYDGLNYLSDMIHEGNIEAGWWKKDEAGNTIERNIGELLCLVHSEISEAMEGFRKSLKDDKLPHREMGEVELADALIRIFDIAGYYQFDLGGAVKEKLEYNRHRADHKPENRAKENGKKF